ncbi:SLC13 family permease [Salinirubrum litoreum]|uniref:SLC13 family permease n=1 Tax=Salinirubrum litoreum TaxID=1126234 RepID=A0ABD5R6M6_9EURY|nr:SLC13 family permease [Salinirubrum litoreum]
MSASRLSRRPDWLTRRRVGLLAGPVGCLALLLAPTPTGLPPTGQATLAVTWWIAVWWLTEAVAIPVTSLLPVVLFPLLGVGTVQSATAPYADPVVFLFLGGFSLALAVENVGLHRRVALAVVGRLGTDPRRLLLGLMLVTAGLSMWLSNTATAMLLLPVALALAGVDGSPAEGGPEQTESTERATSEPPGPLHAPNPALEAGETVESPTAVALLLGVAYAASVGGVATPVGSPPNAILVGVARSTLGVDVAFAEWLAVGLPLAVGFLVVTWVVLVRLFPLSADALSVASDPDADATGDLPPVSVGERRVAIVFLAVAGLWLARPFLLADLAPGLTDAGIAVAGAVALFLLPGEDGPILSWGDTERVPWGVLLLFGAGFSLAAAVRDSGLDEWVADLLVGVGGLPAVLVILVVALGTTFLTEITSNTATASLLLPILAAVAPALGVPALPLLTVGAMAASFAFMLPVATPPNAVVFGSGLVSVPTMARAGVLLNVLGALFVTLLATGWVPVVWG